MNIADKSLPMRKGLLEMAVLKIIAARKVYAADILERLASTDFATHEGTLYPLLSRLRRDGVVVYDWTETAAGPPRKYYRLTDLGRTRLFQLEQYWRTINDTLDAL